MKRIIFVIMGLVFLKMSAQVTPANSNTMSVIPGNSDNNNQNINSPTGTLFQDIKRSTCIIINKSGEAGTATLVNTVENSFVDGKIKYYLLTADHLLQDADFNSDLYISFDYEMPGSVRATSADQNTIAEVVQIPMKELVRDKWADIALLEIDPEVLSFKAKIFFQNAYAVGWALNSPQVFNDFANISHPKNDAKKVFIRPNDALFYTDDKNSPPRTTQRKIRTGQWNNPASNPQQGSDGSGLFDKSDENHSYADKLIAVNTEAISFNGQDDTKASTVFTLLQNAWNKSLNRNEEKPGLRQFLDPNRTWISNIEGGYVNNLIKNSDNLQHQLFLDDIQYEFERTLNVDRFYMMNFNNVGLEDPNNLDDSFYRQASDESLGHGFDFGNSSPPPLNTTVSLEVSVQPNITSNVGARTVIYKSEFLKSRVNDGDTFPRDFRCTDCENVKNASLKMKEKLTNAMAANLKTNGSFRSITGNFPKNTSLKREKAKFIFKMSRSGVPAAVSYSVKGIRVPMLMPENATQAFGRSDAMSESWRSRKYDSSRGINTNFYIDQVSISESLKPKTGDNGGYLNLVNRNLTSTFQSISDALPYQPNLPWQIVAKSKTSTNRTVYYKIWIDYNIPSTNPNSLDYDPQIISEGTINLISGEGTVDAQITLPRNSVLQYSEDEIVNKRGRYCRIRIALSSENSDDMRFDKVYAEGEVEDYQIKFFHSSVNLDAGGDGDEGGNDELKQSKGDKEVIAENPIVFPNPVADVFNLFIGAKKPSILHLTIHDLAGKLMYEKNVNILEKGNKILTFRDFKLNASAYILKIKSDDLDWSTKLIVK